MPAAAILSVALGAGAACAARQPSPQLLAAFALGVLSLASSVDDGLRDACALLYALGALLHSFFGDGNSALLSVASALPLAYLLGAAAVAPDDGVEVPVAFVSAWLCAATGGVCYARHAARAAASKRAALLLFAAGRGDAAALLRLFEGGTVDYGPALRVAAANGHARAVRLLLARGADCESVLKGPSSGYTPLHEAALRGRNTVVGILVDAGADPSAGSADGITPLHLAAREGLDATVALLLDKGAPLEARRAEGGTPLALAAAAGRVSTARLLLARGADGSAVDKRGLTPHDHAARAPEPVPELIALLAPPPPPPVEAPERASAPAPAPTAVMRAKPAAAASAASKAAAVRAPAPFKSPPKAGVKKAEPGCWGM